MLGELIQTFDWARTAVGPIESWPAEMRTTVSLMLRSPVPIATLWGADGVMIYNDAYAEVAAERHPKLLGSRVLEGWPEVADFNAHVLATCMAGESLSFRDQELTLMRRGRAERVWMNLDYSPILGPAGDPMGVLAIVVETTAKVLAEGRLSVERLSAMFEQAPGFIAMLEGPDHVFTLANRAYRRLMGREDLIGMSASQALSGQAARNFNELLDRVYREGTPFVGRGRVYPVPLENNDIEERFLDYICYPFFDEAGAVLGLFVQGNDVTEELRSIEALREREAQLSAFISQSVAGFGQVDLEGRFTLVNDRFCEIAGRSREELLTLSMQDITHPDDLPANVPKFESAVKDGTPFTHENRYVRPDGSIVWVNNSVSVVRGAEGKPFGVLAITLDVTERRQVEAAIHENEARLRALTNNLPGGMVYQLSTGPDGRNRKFLFVSDNYDKLTGIAAEAVLANSSIPYDIILPGDRAILAAAEREAYTQRSPFDIELRFRHASGETRWCRIIAAPREQSDGSMIWDGLQIDITEQKRLEADLHRLNETLEQRVRERTAELERVHEQLRQSQKLEAMGQLTGGVAHDFNNLLTPIIGSLDMLQRRQIGGDREQRMIGGALESAERAKILVQRLLAFARRQPLQPGPVSLHEVVADMSDLVASTSGPKVRLVVDVPAELPLASADRNQLEMAILNLCVNARDAMPDGGMLSISAEQEMVEEERGLLQPGAYLRLKISDTGSGMDEETLAKAIEPFFSTKGIGKGTGLGLSMVHGLTSQLGGALQISSRLGLGTTVDMYLPQSQAAPSRPDEARPEAAAGKGAGTILLVEDEPAVRASSTDMMVDLGYQVAAVEDAAAALAWLAENRADIVVTDHLMPGMSGTELARTIGRHYPGMPILIISGYADVEGISPDLAHLAKPFRQAELAAALGDLSK